MADWGIKKMTQIMDKKTFLQWLRNNPAWDNMLKRGGAGVKTNYKNVEFLIFRDDASLFLRVVPSSSSEVLVIEEFNALLESCRSEITEELEKWNVIRLNKDDNEGAPIR